MADRTTPARRSSRRALIAAVALTCLGALTGCTTAPAARGTGDLGLIIERATGRAQIVDTTLHRKLATVTGLGDLSHASVVFSRDTRYAYVFGRDGGLTRVDLLAARITHRTVQAGNSIGGAISQDGRIVAAQNYEPGGVRLFDADTLKPLADIPAVSADGRRSKVVGLVDLPGQRFAASLFEAGEIWLIDASDPARPAVEKFAAGKQPYDALVTPDGRHYLAGLYGEDGLARVDLWQTPPAVKKVMPGYGRGETPLPVYKMPHLRGWAIAQGEAWLPAIGRHEVLVADTRGDWKENARVAVAGQPVFVMARPDGRQVWVNFAFPDNDKLQVIDTQSRRVIRTLQPCKGVLHMEFTPKGEEIWFSCRDDNRIEIYRTDSMERLMTLPADNPSGIFFTPRAFRFGM